MSEYGRQFHARRKEKPYYQILADAIVKQTLPWSGKKRYSSVLDVGCSCGALLSCFKDIPERLGVDHGVPQDLFPEGCRYEDMDLLARPYQGSHPFDLITCLEVAEHIPDPSCKALLQTLRGNADTGTVLVFSSAKPGQRGKNHVNCQPSWQWIERLRDYDFGHSAPMTNNLIASAGNSIPECYRSNIMVFSFGAQND